MDEHLPPAGTPTTTGAILVVLTAMEPYGARADHVARTLGLGLDGAVVQGEWEDLMARGHGTIYMLSAAGWTWMR